MERIGIIGGGAWGTALAQTLVRAGRDVVLWAHEADTVAAINSDHENPHLPAGRGARPGDARDGGACRRGRSATPLLLVVPAQHLRGVTARLPLSRRACRR